jgi:alkaline phosphatase D
LIEAMAQASNPVVLSGDWHSAAAMRLHRDPWNAKSPRVGHNFCGTSISSHCPWADNLHRAKAANPHVDYLDGDKRGYFRAVVTPRQWLSQYRTVEAPNQAGSALSTAFEARAHDL